MCNLVRLVVAATQAGVGRASLALIALTLALPKLLLSSIGVAALLACAQLLPNEYFPRHGGHGPGRLTCSSMALASVRYRNNNVACSVSRYGPVVALA